MFSAMSKQFESSPGVPSHPEIIVKMEPPFLDARGAIIPLVEADMKSALLIHSKPGSVRANHYHKSDWHYCYVLSGAIDYYHRPHGSMAAPDCVRINAGQTFFTPPMVDHAMKFPVDTSFLTLSRNARDSKSYEEDTIKVELVKT